MQKIPMSRTYHVPMLGNGHLMFAIDTNTTHICKANLSVIALPFFVKYAELQAHAHNF